MQPTTPIQKNVVLVGAGNAHLRFLKMFAMRPLPGVAVTLVSDSAVVPYSAMVPGHIAGAYTFDDISIDLVRLCRAAGARLLAEPALGVDPGRRVVTFANRPELSYDVLGLGPGSLPVIPPGLAGAPNSWSMRPLARLVERLTRLEEELTRSPGAFHLVVAGGGASGCELSLAIHRRLGHLPGFRLTLVQGHDRLLPTFATRTGRLFGDLLRQHGIEVRLGSRVVGGDQATLELDRGERLAYDAVLWATNAAPPALLASVPLPRTQEGFLLVGPTLQAVGDPAIFGSGDCVSITSCPDLTKNGVHAVRQGGVLFDNIDRFLRDRPLRTFRPQRLWLCLLNTADGAAVFAYGPLVWKGRAARWLKDRIDRAWLDGFRRLAPMAGDSPEDAPAMRCGGCGSKISADVLSAVLRRLEVGDDPRVLLGCQAGEDAAVHRFRPELFGTDPAQLVEVQTVDHFRSFIDDPYLFGRISALHAVSDLQAMNARPFSALAVVTLPHARGPVQEALLFELLSGAVDSLRPLGVTLTGGHTSEGAELALGFAVTGHGEESRLFRKGALQPGDRLIVTRPLGSGALLAAWMRGQCRAGWFEKLMHELLQGNAVAAQVLAAHGVRACTDVTGFGLAGHLLEMLDASGHGARLDVASVPLHVGFAEVAAAGILSSLQPDNARLACRIQGREALPAWLFDPQTAGGLLAGVPAEESEEVLRELRECGHDRAEIIGEVVASAPGEGPGIVLG